MEIVELPFNIEQDKSLIIKDWLGYGCYRFSSNIGRVDKMIEWIFENTHKRFFLLGTNRIYFESEADAMAFKLVWL